MFNLETIKLKISESFKKKIEIICSFAGVKCELIEGSIISVKDTNLGYVRPHILKVKGNDYLLFEDAKIVFVNGYKDKIKLTELEEKIHTRYFKIYL